MAVHRRDVLCGLGFAAAAAFRDFRAEAEGAAPQAAPSGFPRTSDFLIDSGYTYLNAAYTHPIPKVSMDAARRAAEGRGTLPPPAGGQSGTPKALFAALINAKPSEIAYVSSTSAGENLVVQALDLERRFDGNVVTEGLHFEGALLYAREDLLDRIRRPVMGYYQASNLEQLFPPNLPEGEYTPLAYALEKSATGTFETGTLTGGPAINVALLTASLNYIMSLGVANIQAHRQPLIKRLQQEVPRLGFTPVTPPESTGPIVTFSKPNLGATDVPRQLLAARVNVRLSTQWMRLSPSVYNDMRDIERFLEILS